MEIIKDKRLRNFWILDEVYLGLDYIANEEETDVSKVLNRELKRYVDRQKERLGFTEWPVVTEKKKTRNSDREGKTLRNFLMKEELYSGLEYLANEDGEKVPSFVNKLLKKFTDKERRRIGLDVWPVVVRASKQGRKPSEKKVKKKLVK